MGRPSDASSDILGIEVGRCAVRGVRLNQDTAELTAAAECVFGADVVSHDGVIDPSVFGPRLDELLNKLDVYDRSQVRVGITIGPRHSGVGSGPSMASWLQNQAINLREPMVCAGGLGIAFVPSRAVDSVVKLASGAGIELVRIDFAPVAAARAIGDQVEDLICLGSGQGWQARMRDFEVLEAMENGEIGIDDPLAIVVAGGSAQSIVRYGWVEIAPELDQSHRLDIAQLAPAVGVAIGVAYESPANLLIGEAVSCGLAESTIDPSLQHLAGYELSGTGAEATLRLQPKAVPDAPASADEDERHKARRTPRQAPRTALSPLGAASPAEAVATEAAVAHPVVAHPVATQGDWGHRVDESDPITMFSPDTEVEQMMGTRDRRLSVDIFVGLLVVSAILLLVAYLYL